MKKIIIFLILIQINHLAAGTFVPNRGQWPGEVRFMAETNGANAWYTDAGVVYDFHTDIITDDSIVVRKGHVVGMRFIENERIVSLEKHEGRIATGSKNNYFIGFDRTKWQTNVPVYKELNFSIFSATARFYTEDEFLRYDIVIPAGVCPENYSLEFSGQKSIDLINNEIILETSIGKIINSKMKTYQLKDGRKIPVDCRIVFDKKNRIKFIPGNYDPSRDLIIDPLLFCSFVGGSSNEYMSKGFTMNNDRNAVFTGMTSSSDFPRSEGAYQSEYKNGNNYCFITKIDTDNEKLLFSTFYGSGKYECGEEIQFDDAGNIIVIGTTQNLIPVTENAYQKAYGGNIDNFICKFTPSGDSLIFSTMLGGCDADISSPFFWIDGDNSITIIGTSKSHDYPVTTDAIQKVWPENAITQGVITKISADGSELIYSSFLGNCLETVITGADINESGEIYIGGWQRGDGFPVTKNAIRNEIEYENEKFLVKINSDLDSILYSTYLYNDQIYGIEQIKCSKNNEVYQILNSEKSGYSATDTISVMSLNGPRNTKLLNKFIDIPNNMEREILLGMMGSADVTDIEIDRKGNLYLSTNSINDTRDFSTSNALQNGYEVWAGGGLYIIDNELKYFRLASYFGNDTEDCSTDIRCIKIVDEYDFYFAGLTQGTLPITSDVGGINGKMKSSVFLARAVIEPLKVEEIGFNGVQNNISLYPNPAKSEITIKPEKELNGLAEISINDMEGKIVLSKTEYIISGNEINLDVSMIPAGAYVVSVTSGGTTLSGKFVKE